MELMQGGVVTKKTDWFDLNEARLQFKSYSQPMMEMAVASARSPTGGLSAGKHGIGMLSIGGTSDDALKAHASNWGVYEESARAHGKTADRRKWRIVTFAHVAETREQARADMKFGLEDFKRYFAEVATFPIVPPDITSDPAEYLVAWVLLASARRTIASAISSGCGAARTAASAACCCWRTIGPTGRRPRKATS